MLENCIEGVFEDGVRYEKVGFVDFLSQKIVAEDK